MLGCWRNYFGCVFLFVSCFDYISAHFVRHYYSYTNNYFLSGMYCIRGYMIYLDLNSIFFIFTLS